MFLETGEARDICRVPYKHVSYLELPHTPDKQLSEQAGE